MLLLALVGCGPATVTPPQPSGTATTICEALIADLPETVEEQQQRDVDPPSGYTAAWGRPPITLACGVSKPAALTRTSECLEVNGVGWFSEDREDDVRFTTIGRETFVQVVVPRDYTAVNPLIDLAAPIKRDVPVVTECV